MTYAALMVHVASGPACEPRLRLAAGLADRLECALIGVGAEVYLPPPEPDVWSYVGESAAAEVGETVQADLRDAEARFRRICGAVAKGAEWRGFAESPTSAIARECRGADLVICCGPPQLDEDVLRRASPSDLLMAAGRPILAGPADADRLDLSRIVVAWKDAREARRALVDAMPLLVRAEEVLVAAAPERDPREDPAIALADVAETIRRHGGHAATRVLDGGSAADAILEAAVEFDAQLIVAGAYGRARLREWAFGGVTRRLLSQDAKFVLMSH
jgi:nucleotide-binding universal stress UspA family protein